jgi:diguanylate cyclase (GGDEF)-like protein/PAS domain S-box-containing protein
MDIREIKFRRDEASMSRTLTAFIKTFGPLALTYLLVGAWFLNNQTEHHRELMSQRQETRVIQSARTIDHEIASYFADARFLSRLVQRTFEDEHGEMKLEELGRVFSDFSLSRPYYFQLRFLDAHGMEQLRVDRILAGPAIIPRESLQPKGDRYYFQESIRGGRGDVYLSNFDLNVERGKVEVPYQPTLRFASPVIDSDGNKLGVVVLNFDGHELLARARARAQSHEGEAIFCDSEGYWFLAPGGVTAWGNILGFKNANMAHHFPEAWQAIRDRETGQVITPAGLFTFATLETPPHALIPITGPMVQDLDRRWKIITWVRPEHLALEWANKFILMTCLALIALGAGSWHFIRSRVSRSLAEARLRESEERLLAISQSAQDAIVLVDAEGRITYWNPAARSMFGYEEEDVLGREVHTFLITDSLALTAAPAQERPERITEIEAFHRDGHPIPVELSTSRFRLKDQWYAVGSMRNISRRRKNEIALKRSEKTARALLNAPTDSAMLIAVSGTILAINETGAGLLGEDAESLVGQSLLTLVEPERAERYRETLRQVLTTGRAARFEDLHRHRRVLVNAYPIKDENGVVENIALFGRDVTEQHLAEAALKKSEQRFRDVSEAVGEYIWETDEDGTFTFVTEDSVFVLGYTAEELMGRALESLIPKDLVDDFRTWQGDLVARREAFNNVEFQVRTKGGKVIWLRVSGVPYFDDDKNFQGYRGAAMDVTEHKEQQEAIKASERQLRALAESAYDGIIMIDTLGKVSFWNEAAEQMFGYGEDEALGRNIHDLVTPPGLRDKAGKGVARFAATGEGEVVDNITEVEAARKDGTLFPVEISVSGFRLGGQWYAVGTVRDITERKATERKLRELATTDGLTSLNNRRRFMELAEQELARSKRYPHSLSMFMMDIDHFKRVNDTYGHDVGDEVLRALSITATRALRDADILGRLGGEEFGVLLPETGADAALEVAERLRLSVEKTPISTSAGGLNITISIGVSVMDPEKDTVETLLKKADVALYNAKENGRNRAVLG